MDGLHNGRTDYAWKAGKAFFEAFGNTEIDDAEVSVEASVEKSGRSIGVDCRIRGKVTVACDRCLDPLMLPVDAAVRLSVCFGDEPEPSEEEVREGEREVLCLPSGTPDLDLGQVVYDYTCLALPIQRVHPDGACNPDTVRYLSSPEKAPEDRPQTEGSLPFAALKSLLNKGK